MMVAQYAIFVSIFVYRFHILNIQQLRPISLQQSMSITCLLYSSIFFLILSNTRSIYWHESIKQYFRNTLYTYFSIYYSIHFYLTLDLSLHPFLCTTSCCSRRAYFFRCLSIFTCYDHHDVHSDELSYSRNNCSVEQ